ncbi:MAG TPA: MaoC family dehydratase N-terminal domain-containing protein [Thermodesulfobacteriota bacterium]|nr:MaoC family dehydratase N-terminal domain-containing protein [Thermodesulfobacteriota bacterium]
MDAQVPEDVLAMIGVEKVRQYDVTKKDIKRFAQAIGETNPVHFDEDYAKTTRHGVIVAPPLFCQMFTFEDVPPDRLPSDGSPVEVDIPVPAQRAIGGGSSYEIFQRVKAGDKIIAKSTLQDVFVKNGKSGRLYFIVVCTEFSNQKNELVAKEAATYIKRV